MLKSRLDLPFLAVKNYSCMGSGQVMRWSYATVILVALLAAAPLLVPGVLPVANDRVQHQSTDPHFRRQLSRGEWYPRWLAVGKRLTG